MSAGVADAETLREELDSQGRTTGVEAETDDLSIEVDIREPFDPDKIDVVTRTMTVDLLLSRIRRGTIDLQPDFQRHAGIWTRRAKSRLIESLLLRIPLPTLYAAAYQDAEGDEAWAIVDGIQRLTTITEFIEPQSISEEPLRLQDMEYLKELEGKYFEDLAGRLQTRLRESELVVHLIRQGTPDAVKFNIFVRINTGGLPLTSQELRHALIPGKARELLKEWADSRAFRVAVGDSISSDRMADREMVLRFIAFRLTAPTDFKNQDFDLFLRQAMKQLNDVSTAAAGGLESDFTSAMVAATEIFGDYAFRKRNPRIPKRRLPVNKAIFESVAVNLANLTDDEREELADRKERVEELFLRLMGDGEFQVAVSQGTGDPAKVRRRFDGIRDLFAEVLS